jgi:hypothetical protein
MVDKTQKTKYCATRIPLKNGVNSDARKDRQFRLHYNTSDTGIQDVVLCCNSKKSLKIPKEYQNS